MTEPTQLNYHDTYSCPVCRHGKIAALPLMEAYACNFCQHIFTANLEQQVLKMASNCGYGSLSFSSGRGESFVMGASILVDFNLCLPWYLFTLVNYRILSVSR